MDEAALPGLIDLGPELDLSASVHDQVEGALAKASGLSVAGFLIGVPPGPPEQMMRACAEVAEMANRPTNGPQILGIRLRSPFLNPVFAPERDLPFLRRPDAGLLGELLSAGQGRIRAVTLSPELPAATPLLRELATRGIPAGIGCSGLSFDGGLRAFREGACFLEDAFGALTRFHHREPGVIGAALLTPGAYLELRPCPGGLHPAMVGICLNVTGPRRVILSGTWSGKAPLAGTALLRYVAGATKRPLRDLVPAASKSAVALLQLDPDLLEVRAN